MLEIPYSTLLRLLSALREGDWAGSTDFQRGRESHEQAGRARCDKIEYTNRLTLERAVAGVGVSVVEGDIGSTHHLSRHVYVHGVPGWAGGEGAVSSTAAAEVTITAAGILPVSTVDIALAWWKWWLVAWSPMGTRVTVSQPLVPPAAVTAAPSEPEQPSFF